MSPLLFVGSTVALALVVAHSWRTRGRSVTLAFFIPATLFGILRGNAVWLVCRFLAEDGSDAMKPYVPQGGLIPSVAHESLQVALGWVFALYLAWTVSELILRRFGKGDSPPDGEKGTVPFSSRVFMIAGLASVFMCAIGWCMETTAVAVGWWYWTLPTRTALFGNANVTAMEAWFSVVPDFLIPFLVIACASTRHGALKWLWLLVFPLHMFAHLAYRWCSCVYLVYGALELLVVVPATLSALRMARGEVRDDAGDRLSGRLFAGALAIFFAVIVFANASAADTPVANILTALPMLMLCLLAWRRLPPAVVAVLSLAGVAGWMSLGPPALWVLAPMVVFLFLKWLEREGEPLRLKLAAPATAAVLIGFSIWGVEADRARAQEFARAWMESDRLFIAGSAAEAEAAAWRADAARPQDTTDLYRVVRQMTKWEPGDLRQAVLVFQHRLPMIVGNLEEILRRDPDWVPVRQDLVRFYRIEGRITDAAEQCRQILRLRPKDGDAAAMLSYLLLREGKVEEAEKACEQAMRLGSPPAEALVNLGVIRFSQGSDNEARRLWGDALRHAPKQPMALLNLERLGETARRRDIDERYLASVSAGPQAAGWVNNLAALGQGYSPADRLRLVEEAAQLDPTYFRAQLNLAEIYVADGPLQDRQRAAWHIRRAVTIARESGNASDLAEALRVQEQVLSASGR